MAKPQPKRAGGGKPPPKPRPAGGKKAEAAVRKDDVYEAEDSDPDEERHAYRYDQVENYEYEMPSDFEDEDIDDEMAFTEEDKKMYGHMFDDQPPKAGSEDEEGSEGGLLSSGESASEEEDEEEEGLSEEEAAEEGEGRGRRRPRDEMDELFGGEEGSSEEEDEEEEEGEDSEGEGGQGEEADGDDEAAAARHRAMVDAVTGGGGAAERRRRRAKEVVVTEAYPESAYNLPGSAAGGELTLSDLIAGLGDSKAKLGAVRKTLERLEKRAAPVSAPLPGPIKQRQERKAGYEVSKKDAEKWLPIVKANREAPTLRFTADRSAVPRVTTVAAIAAQHRPENDMEAEVAALLEKAGAHSAMAVAEAEEALAMKALSVEELRERQNRLARMRALLFYHESKSKRMKKIKSKEYRRKLKKAEKRKAVAGGEEGEEEELRLEQEAAEYDRAKERLTLKHKNTSRWARRLIRRGQTVMDDGTKAALQEQLRMGEELRQRVNKMKARGSDSDGSTSASEGDSSEGEEGGQAGGGGDTFSGPQAGRGMGSKAKAAALELLQGKGDPDGAPAKGLFALPFMKRAMEKKKQEAQQEAEEILAELEGGSAAAAAAAGGAGRAGRLAFTGTGVDQRQQWQRVARLEAAALNDDSDMASDEDEDAEAKAQRLGQRLGLQPPAAGDSGEDAEGEDGRRRGQQGAGDASASQQQAAAGAAAAAAAARGAVAVTDGPISVDLPAGGSGGGSKRRKSASASAGAGSVGGVAAANGTLEALRQQQRGGAAQQDWLFSGKPAEAAAAGGGAKRRAGAAGAARAAVAAAAAAMAAAAGVTIGPASGAAAERQQNGAAAPADTGHQQQQQGEGGEGPPAPSFVRSKAFQGSRAGYVYKKGPQGVGYYLDGIEAVKAAKAAVQRQKRQEAGERRQQRQQEAAPQRDANPADSDDDEHNMKPVQGLSQAELIARAFAGDDVQQEFAAAKAAEVEGELPQEEVPGLIPGWGTWASQQREPKWVTDAKRKAKQRKEAAAAGRQDAKLQYVVISEKWDKKSSKYKTPSVPFPFDSKETYERSMRQPLGRDYNTDVSFRNLTRPAIIKDAGVIIEPVRFSKAMATYDEQVPKNAKRAAVTTIAGGMPKKSKKKH